MNKAKSVRLNAYLRKEILDSVMLEFTRNKLGPMGFDSTEQLKQRILQEGVDVLTRLWDETYGKLGLGRLPVWATNQSNKFTIAQEGDTSRTYEQYIHWGERTVLNRRPCKAAVDLLVTAQEWEGLLCTRHALQRTLTEYDQESTKLRREVSPVLESFGSTKQLLDAWPSMEKFLPPNIADPDKGINLPALSLSRLEAKINGN